VKKDWSAWHRAYDEPGSSLRRRLDVVQAHIAAGLDAFPPGRIRTVSMCAGQGRDLLGVLARHPRRRDVIARLVELDDRNVEHARTAVRSAGLGGGVQVVRADASDTMSYEGAVPADLVLACGVFGNVSDHDVRTTVQELPALCAAGAMVIWTRHPRRPQLLTLIDGWFSEAGFARVAIETGDGGRHFGVGVHRYAGPPRAFRPGVRLFTFLDEPDAAATAR